MTHDRSIDVWRDALEYFGVDETAIMELFLLSQHARPGYEEAHAIIAKVLKKQSDNVSLKNGSGFVHSACMNARSSMAQRGGAKWWGSSSWEDK